jgi:hypothetical protein
MKNVLSFSSVTFSKYNLFSRYLTIQVVVALAVPLFVGVSRAGADEFAIVPAGDPAYRQLASIAQTGWIEARNFNSQAGAKDTTAKDTTLTRYEIALEAARGIYLLTARREAGDVLATLSPRSAVTSRNALLALRELTVNFRTELKGLGVDVAAALRLCDELLPPKIALGTVGKPEIAAANAGTRSSGAAVSIAPRVSGQPAENRTLGNAGTNRAVTNLSATTSPRSLLSARPLVSERLRLRNSEALDESLRPTSIAELSLSQRLRVSTASSMLLREAADPFGDAANGGRARVGLSLGMSKWLSVRAGASYRNYDADRVPLSLSPLEASNPRPVRGVDGGVDIALPRGVMLSGEFERVALAGEDSAAWRRFGGAVGVSAWQNRLSLKANLSRLVPDDTRMLPTTLGGVNLGLDVSERLSLTLLYQQLFDMPTESGSNRLVAGGVSINF